MKKHFGYGAVSLTVLSLLVVTTRHASTQVGGTLPSFVQLQTASPGVPQTGNSNVTGTARAGQFVGGGAGVTGVNATLLDGLDSTAFLQGVPNPLNLSGSVAIGAIVSGTNSSTTGRGVYGLASATTGAAYGVFGESQSTSGRAVLGLANATTGTNYGGFFDSDSVSGYGVFANSAGTYGVFGRSTLATGTGYGVYGETASTSGAGVYGDSTATTGLNWGGRFRSASTAGSGVSGFNTAATGTTFGGRFETSSTSGRGVFGYAGAATGTTYGVFGQSDSTSGRGVYGRSASGIGGLFNSTSGEALRAESNGLIVASIVSTVAGLQDSTALVVQGDYRGGDFFGEIYGIEAQGRDSGVYGRSVAQNTSGVGVRGFSNSTDGSGVEGTSGGVNGTGVTGFSNYRGVYADAFNNNGPTAYGVWGQARTSPGRGVYGVADASDGSSTNGVRGFNPDPNGFGVFSSGAFGASGTKSFVIDHPLDPANKYLKHYCTEGPVPKNVYDGTAVTDANGWATVVLPDYFMEINKDPRVQLTVVDSSEDFVMVKRVGEFTGNTFRIRTSKGRVKVDWEVKATRNDAWVRQNGAPVEVAKDADERGKYQHPELHGMPKEMGIDYDPRAEVAQKRATPQARRQTGRPAPQRR